jgi:hypothetical protein
MKKNDQKNGDKKEQIFQSGEVMSMLEQMNDGIQLIAEQHGEVIKRLDNHDSRFDNLESKVDRLQEDVTEIKHKLSEKVDREEFEKLEKRMIKLEKLVFAKLN